MHNLSGFKPLLEIAPPFMCPPKPLTKMHDPRAYEQQFTVFVKHKYGLINAWGIINQLQPAISQISLVSTKEINHLKQ